MRMEISGISSTIETGEPDPSLVQGGVPVERRIGDNEIIANIIQHWQMTGIVGEDARFIFSIDERAQRDLLARASVLQTANHQSAYGKIQPPPDISGLMSALPFYFGGLESETTEVGLLVCVLFARSLA